MSWVIVWRTQATPKYLPFWFTSGWRSSISSCFFCNSSWTSVSFSLSSGESMELCSQKYLRRKVGLCHIIFMGCEEGSDRDFCFLTCVRNKHLATVTWAGVKIYTAGTCREPKCSFSCPLPFSLPKIVLRVCLIT